MMMFIIINAILRLVNLDADPRCILCIVCIQCWTRQLCQCHLNNYPPSLAMCVAITHHTIMPRVSLINKSTSAYIHILNIVNKLNILNLLMTLDLMSLSM